MPGPLRHRRLRHRRPRARHLRHARPSDLERQTLPQGSFRPIHSLRSGSLQRSDAADQPEEGAQRGSALRADLLGRGARPRRPAAERSAQEGRGAPLRAPDRARLGLERCWAHRRFRQALRHAERHARPLLDVLGRQREGEAGSRRQLLLQRLRLSEHQLSVELRGRLPGSLSSFQQQHAGVGPYPHESAQDQGDGGRRSGNDDRCRRRPSAARQARHRRDPGTRDRLCDADRGALGSSFRGRLQRRPQPLPARPRGPSGRVRGEVDQGSRPLVERRAQGSHARLGGRDHRHPGEAARRGGARVRHHPAGHGDFRARPDDAHQRRLQRHGHPRAQCAHRCHVRRGRPHEPDAAALRRAALEGRRVHGRSRRGSCRQEDAAHRQGQDARLADGLQHEARRSPSIISPEIRTSSIR